MKESIVWENEMRESEVRENEMRESEVRENETRESEVRESEVRESEVRESEVRESEVRENETKESEVRDSEVRESEVRQSDVRQSDVRENLMRAVLLIAVTTVLDRATQGAVDIVQTLVNLRTLQQYSATEKPCRAQYLPTEYLIIQNPLLQWTFVCVNLTCSILVTLFYVAVSSIVGHSSRLRDFILFILDYWPMMKQEHSCKLVDRGKMMRHCTVTDISRFTKVRSSQHTSHYFRLIHIFL
jgi:hypothetical protein